MKSLVVTGYTKSIIDEMNVVVENATRDSRTSSKDSIQAIFSTLPLLMDDDQYDVINTHRIASVKLINKL